MFTHVAARTVRCPPIAVFSQSASGHSSPPDPPRVLPAGARVCRPGYDVHDRKLVVNEAEAETVRHIFRSYSEVGSVRLLAQRLRDEGIRSKLHRKADGSMWGGKPQSRGALYLLLQNRLYRGEISHRGAVYPGEHAAIIDATLWDAVQQQLTDHRANGSERPKGAIPNLLARLLHDEAGDRLVPSHAVKGGKRYRYYVSSRLITGSRARVHSKASLETPSPNSQDAGDLAVSVGSRASPQAPFSHVSNFGAGTLESLIGDARPEFTGFGRPRRLSVPQRIAIGRKSRRIRRHS
jgi:site-specific DNA recombinase